MSVLDGPMVIVDVETTGMSAAAGRIIEIGAIRIEGGQIAGRLNNLINPQMAVNPYIQTITGIRQEQLVDAPVFEDIAQELEDLMEGAVFIAHNVRFDYSFVRAELKRLGKNFKPRMLCSVKLSRQLYSHYRGHSLEAIINRHAIKVAKRHRAFDDAKAVWEFIKIAQIENSVEAVEAAIGKQIGEAAVPVGLERQLIKNLSEGPGVYIFKDSNNQPLYIGKSVNIKKRVMSHFSSDHSSGKEMNISRQVCDVTAYKTNGELEALLLEAQLVKELQPLYNRRLRRIKKLTLAVAAVDGLGYQRVSLEEASSNSLDPSMLQNVLGVYPTKGRAKQILESYAKIYGLCPKMLGLENGPGPCFAYQLKKCSGACMQKEIPAKHNFRVTTAFDTTRMRAWPYQGPVMLSETGPELEGMTGIVVDQWCVVAHIKENNHSDPVVKTTAKYFDLDTYKILQSFIARRRPNISIKPLTRNQFDQLMAVA